MAIFSGLSPAARPATAEDWYARMAREPVSRANRDAFEAWLDADPANLAAYEAVHRLLAVADEGQSAFAAEVDRLIRQPQASLRRAWLLPAGIGLAMASVAAAAFVISRPVPEPLSSPVMAAAIQATTYATAHGEIRDLQLADGSALTLDTDTEISVTLERDERRVTLVHGGVFFDVAKDKSRPFHVAAGAREVIVTGTEFVVSLEQDRARVSLLEGGVLVTAARGGDGGTLRLSPGEAVTYAGAGGLTPLPRIDVAIEGAWRRRQLVFRNATLGEAFTEISRYAKARIDVDPALADRRVTGILALEGGGDLLERADQIFPVRIVRETGDDVHVQPE